MKIHPPARIRTAALASFLVLSGACLAGFSDPVGYTTGIYHAGINLIASPFNPDGDPSVNTLVHDVFSATLPAGSFLQTYTAGSYQTYSYDGVIWRDGTGATANTFSLPMAVGAVLQLPSAADVVYSGAISWVSGLDTEGPVIAIAPGAPYSSGIHLLGNTNPAGFSTFDQLVGRSPVAGDAVLQYDEFSGVMISTYLGSQWDIVPEIGVGESAFFDLSGNGFSGFNLPPPVPETSTGLLVMTAGLLLLSKRRR